MVSNPAKSPGLSNTGPEVIFKTTFNSWFLLFLSKFILMIQQKEFFEYINAGYKTKGDFIELGAAMLGEETITNALVKVPLKTLNRHGLIAGATGTGKTKTLQVLAENLSVVFQVSYFKYTRKKTGVGKRIFLMAPLHHHYQKRGYHESKIVTRFWIVGILLAVISILTLKVR